MCCHAQFGCVTLLGAPRRSVGRARLLGAHRAHIKRMCLELERVIVETGTEKRFTRNTKKKSYVYILNVKS